jgi:hypothetical protein
MKAFVAKSDTLLKIKWIKMLDFSTDDKPGLNNYGMVVENTDNGCIVLIHSSNANAESEISFSHLIRFNENGEKLLNKEINTSLVPRHLIFDDINEISVIAFHGKSINYDESSLDEMIINLADSSGTNIWSTKITFQGNIVDIIKTNENFLVIGNFSKIINTANQIIEITNNNKNAFAAFINKAGQIEDLKIFNSGISYYLIDAVKINSEVVNLLGFKDINENISHTKNKNIKIAYILVDIRGNQLYSY